MLEAACENKIENRIPNKKEDRSRFFLDSQRECLKKPSKTLPSAANSDGDIKKYRRIFWRVRASG